MEGSVQFLFLCLLDSVVIIVKINKESNRLYIYHSVIRMEFDTRNYTFFVCFSISFYSKALFLFCNDIRRFRSILNGFLYVVLYFMLTEYLYKIIRQDKTTHTNNIIYYSFVVVFFTSRFPKQNSIKLIYTWSISGGII